MNSDKEPIMKTAFEKAADIVAAKTQGRLEISTVSCAVSFIGEMLEERASEVSERKHERDAARREMERLSEENKFLRSRLDLIKRHAELEHRWFAPSEEGA